MHEPLVMGYDIEVVTEDSAGSFPLASSPVKCITAWTKYSELSFHNLQQCDEAIPYSMGCDKSEEVCKAFIDHVRTKSPMYLVGYHCFSFDNVYILYHVSNGPPRHDFERVEGDKFTRGTMSYRHDRGEQRGCVPVARLHVEEEVPIPQSVPRIQETARRSAQDQSRLWHGGYDRVLHERLPVHRPHIAEGECVGEHRLLLRRIQSMRTGCAQV